MAKAKTRRKVLIFSGIIIILAGLSGWAFMQKREPIITVQTEKVSRRNLTEIVVANGKIQPVVQVKISAEVSGEIIELPVKEGQQVNKGDLLVKIKPDFYVANRNQAQAGYKSSLSSKATAEANLMKAAAEFRRGKELIEQKLISDSVYDELKASFAVASAQLTNSIHQVEMAAANLASAEEQLAKTTIYAPLSGTVSKLNSQLGERVLGTVQNVGTEIMIIADLNEMEARVDIGEVDVVLINADQNVRLEVDAFKDRKFTGSVTEIANSAKGAGFTSAAAQTDATKFEVKIRIKEKEQFRPGMSVTAEIETRCRTNALAVPIASVTTRLPKGSGTNNLAKTSGEQKEDPDMAPAEKVGGRADRKKAENNRPLEVVFLKDGEKAKMVPVKIGISDDDYWEITEGLQEDQEVVSGSYRAISRELEDGKKIRLGPAPGEKTGKAAEKKS